METPRVIGLLDPTSFGRGGTSASLSECDLLELRFDLFPDADPAELARNVRAAFPETPVLFTVRLERDLGRWPDARAAERTPLFARALETGIPAWVDAELSEPGLVRALKPLCAERGAKLLVSSHFRTAPESAEECERPWNESLALGPDGVKLVWSMDDRSRESLLLDFVLRHRNDGRLRACFAMGKGGRLSRLFAPLAGAPWTYGFAGTGAPAPGQWEIARMRDCFAKTSSYNPENGANRLLSDLEEWEKANFPTFAPETSEDE